MKRYIVSSSFPFFVFCFHFSIFLQYCSVCGKWRWEDDVTAAMRVLGDDSPPSTPPSSPLLLSPPSGGSSSTDTITTPRPAETLEEKCPQPHASSTIVEFPWDLELLYDRGRTLLMKISVRRNPKKAWDLLHRAAKRGHPAAQWDILLRKSDEDEIDWDRAVEFYVRQMTTSPNYSSVAAFCLGCCFLGGWGVEREEDRAVQLYKASVRKGYLKGMNEVGWIYDHGLGGVTRDSVAAFRCFHALAKRGYALAQYNTARCYRDGRGVEVNWKKGVKWFGRSSAQGYHNAQRSLAHIYQTGIARDVGVKQDLVRAMELYRESAANGDPAGVQKIMEMTKNSKITYEGMRAAKEPASYFEEVKKRSGSRPATPMGTPDLQGRRKREELESKTQEESILASPGVEKKESEKKAEASTVGEYWVPKLFDQCCMILWKGERSVYMEANIPMNVKRRVDTEALQCSAGCGTLFFGKGRVTRTFAERKVIRKTVVPAPIRMNADGRQEVEGDPLRTALWKDTGKLVTMHFCSKACAEGFFSQGTLWNY